MRNPESHVSLSHPRTNGNETKKEASETKCETSMRQLSLKALASKALGRDTTRDTGEKTSHIPVRQTNDYGFVSRLTYIGVRHETNDEIEGRHPDWGKLLGPELRAKVDAELAAILGRQ